VIARSDSLETVNQSLKDSGITHILLFPGMFRFVALMGREGSGPSGSQFQGFHPLKLFGESRTRGPESVDGLTKPDYQGQLETWATFGLYARSFLELVYKDRDDFQLYRIK
jgi:hypothetical protein